MSDDVSADVGVDVGVDVSAEPSMASTAAVPAGFLEHVGPIADEGASASTLLLQQHHLNIGGRFHGGMLMTFAVAALERVAGKVAAIADPDAQVRMLSLDVQFISAALGGVRVRADVDLTRVTRTMVFLTARLSAGAECLATVGAVYRIATADAQTQAHEHLSDQLAASTPPPDLAAWTEAVWREPFSKHVGRAYERPTADGAPAALFEVHAGRLCADRPVMHDGMALFIADVFTGRASSRASTARCVTLSMQVRRLGDVPAGAWVQFEPQVRKLSPSVVFADGVLSCAGEPVLAVASVWKILGAP